jgi:hypothetical protein
MAGPNTDRLRAGYEALAGNGSWPAEPPLLGPDFELHQDPMLDTAKVFRGPDAPAELIATTSGWLPELTIAVDRFIETGPAEVVAIVRLSGRSRSGMSLNREQAHVWHFEGERAREMTVHGSPREALRVLGLEEWPSP